MSLSIETQTSFVIFMLYKWVRDNVKESVQGIKGEELGFPVLCDAGRDCISL